jgi:hypothetical protein
MRHSFKVALGVVATSVVAVVALPVGLAGASAQGVTVRVSTAVPAATAPNSNIKVKGGKSVYKPTALSTTYTAASGSTCTASEVVLTISNKTTKTEKITFQGVTYALPKGYLIGFCLYGSGPASGTFGLKKSTSTLTVTVD